MENNSKNIVLSTNTAKLNKHWISSVLDVFYLSRLTQLKFKGEPLFTVIGNSIKYTFSNQKLQNIESTEISFVEDYNYKDGKLFEIFKLDIPNLTGASNKIIDNFYEQLTDVLTTISEYKTLEFFYYDRKEQIEDYESYFKQLDLIREEKQNFYTDKGRRLSDIMRKQIEDDLSILIKQSKARTRECFIIVSQECETTEKLAKSIEKIEYKIEKLKTTLDSINIDFSQIQRGREQDWLFNNFVSHKSKY